MKNRLAYYLDDFYTLNKGKNKQDFFYADISASQKVIVSFTYKPADISEFAESKFTSVTKNIYICSRQHGREKSTKQLSFFFP